MRPDPEAHTRLLAMPPLPTHPPGEATAGEPAALGAIDSRHTHFVMEWALVELPRPEGVDTPPSRRFVRTP
jgi:hypothetical protein